VATGKDIREFQGHSDDVSRVSFSPDGRQALTGSWDSTPRLWDVATGEELWVTPRPFWSEATWGWDDLVVTIVLLVLFYFVPTVKLFDRGRILYLRKPNPYITLYDLPGVKRWLPK
jgi:WD40 repeat protein